MLLLVCCLPLSLSVIAGPDPAACLLFRKMEARIKSGFGRDCKRQDRVSVAGL